MIPPSAPAEERPSQVTTPHKLSAGAVVMHTSRFMHPSTLEFFSIEAMPKGGKRSDAEKEWMEKYPIEAKNKFNEWRLERLAYLCERYMGKKLAFNRNNP